jgi:outer membrane immunogenic protein
MHQTANLETHTGERFHRAMPFGNSLPKSTAFSSIVREKASSCVDQFERRPIRHAHNKNGSALRMKLRSLAVACLLSIGAMPALAADLPARMVTKAPAMAPAFSWTGFYIGGNVGYAWGETHGSLPTTAGVGNFDVNGIFGGGQVGFNYQMSNWVFGIEADYQGADIDGTSAALAGNSMVANVERFGTVRGRLGFAWDRWMVYGTGGYAFGARVTTNTTVPTALFTPTANNLDGWAAGAGVEYAFAPNWSAKLEYLHVDLDSQTYSVNAGCVATPGACQLGTRLDTVRLGVNWRFMNGF